MYSNALRIHIRQAFQPVYSHHLVFHFGLSAPAVDGLLKGGAAVGCAAVVLDIHHVSLLGHEHFPHADIPKPTVLYHLGMRTAVNVND